MGLPGNITQGTFSKWLARKEAIFSEAADFYKRRLLKCRPSCPNYADVEAVLMEKFKRQRAEGRRVSARWLKKTAVSIAKDLSQVDLKLPGGGFFCSFVETISR